MVNDEMRDIQMRDILLEADEMRDILLETRLPLIDVLDRSLGAIIDYIRVVLGKKEVAWMYLNCRSKKQLDDAVDMVRRAGVYYKVSVEHSTNKLIIAECLISRNKEILDFAHKVLTSLMTKNDFYREWNTFLGLILRMPPCRIRYYINHVRKSTDVNKLQRKIIESAKKDRESTIRVLPRVPCPPLVVNTL